MRCVIYAAIVLCMCATIVIHFASVAVVNLNGRRMQPMKIKVVANAQDGAPAMSTKRVDGAPAMSTERVRLSGVPLKPVATVLRSTTCDPVDDMGTMAMLSSRRRRW